VSFGVGSYRTDDGGDTWTHMGLGESERISKIVIDPTNTSTVYASVPGKLWSDSNDRGLYRTTDAGKTWKLVLKGPNASTGCASVSMDPTHPHTLFAGMWDFRRKGWTFRSGGDSPAAASGSGLFKSDDGGDSWHELTAASAKGLPAKPWGRVCVAVAPSKPKVVYALIECAPPSNGLYRSDDGGATWTLLDRSQYMVWRPFYFANLIVDPKDENRLYKPDLTLIASTDGGKSFTPIGGGTHGDHHDVWVDPENTDYLITGDDGGVWYTRDGGNRWWKANNLPVSQFYHVSLDMDTPYHVYGGLQDNSSWVGASTYPGGITNSQWENMYGGDGFWMFPDSSDPDYLYCEAQGGEIGRVNRRTLESRGIKPLPAYGEPKLRFNWNTPIHMSPTQKGTLYIGAQYLFRSHDHGQTWDRISPDLTTNDPQKQKQEQSGGVTIDNSAAETHTTIYAICESPKNPAVIWVGTDDGNLQVTKDGGRTWTNVVHNVPGLPKDAWVSYIDAGHFDAGTAYATFDLHMSGDLKPYVYRTTDYGKSWKPLVAKGSAMRGYVHVVKEDPVAKDLLFVGTEFGLWVSVDGGAHWAQYKGGELPSVAVRDLAIHPRDNDLAIATHGRGMWIVDDITPLRALTSSVLAKNAAFVSQRATIQLVPANGGWANGDATFEGESAPEDAMITYYQAKRHIFGDMKIEVLDKSGTRVGTVPASPRRGLSRAEWSMRLKPPPVPPAASGGGGASQGPRLLPGTYTVKMTRGDEVLTTPLVVASDPRSASTLADRQEQWDLSMKLYKLLGDMTYTVERMNGVRANLNRRAQDVAADAALAARLRAAGARTDSLRKQIVATTEGGAITGEERLREQLTDLYGGVTGWDGKPTRAQVQRAESITRSLDEVSRGFESWLGPALAQINRDLAAKGLDPVTPLSREEWNQKHPDSGGMRATQSGEDDDFEFDHDRR